jgi:two-component system chemotaxis response regulator CheY
MMTILVVDDSRYMRNVVKSYFKELGLEPDFLEATNGKEALDYIGAKKINLVLLDWNMPKMSGIEFLKAVRELPDQKDLPIIMVTSEAAKMNVVEAFKCGATDYVLKPINSGVFKDKLREILDVK